MCCTSNLVLPNVICMYLVHGGGYPRADAHCVMCVHMNVRWEPHWYSGCHGLQLVLNWPLIWALIFLECVGTPPDPWLATPNVSAWGAIFLHRGWDNVQNYQTSHLWAGQNCQISHFCGRTGFYSIHLCLKKFFASMCVGMHMYVYVGICICICMCACARAIAQVHVQVRVFICARLRTCSNAGKYLESTSHGHWQPPTP